MKRFVLGHRIAVLAAVVCVGVLTSTSVQAQPVDPAPKPRVAHSVKSTAMWPPMKLTRESVGRIYYRALPGYCLISTAIRGRFYPRIGKCDSTLRDNWIMTFIPGKFEGSFVITQVTDNLLAGLRSDRPAGSTMEKPRCLAGAGAHARLKTCDESDTGQYWVFESDQLVLASSAPDLDCLTGKPGQEIFVFGCESDSAEAAQQKWEWSPLSVPENEDDLVDVQVHIPFGIERR